MEGQSSATLTSAHEYSQVCHLTVSFPPWSLQIVHVKHSLHVWILVCRPAEVEAATQQDPVSKICTFVTERYLTSYKRTCMYICMYLCMDDVYYYHCKNI